MGWLRACPACCHALAALAVREFDHTEPGLPETRAMLPASAKPRFHVQCLVYTRGSGGQQALSSDQCLSSENVLSQAYSVLPQTDLLCTLANCSNPEDKTDKSEVESVFQLVALLPNTRSDE